MQARLDALPQFVTEINGLDMQFVHVRSRRASAAVLEELGYEVTVVKDARADYSDGEMHAALEINIPNYASAIVTTNEIVELISCVQIWQLVRSSFT